MDNMNNIGNMFAKSKLLRLTLIFLGVLAGVYAVYRLAYYFAPFIIAFLLSSAMEPLIRFCMIHLKIKRKIAAPVILVLFVGMIATLLFILIAKLISEIISFSHIAPGFFSQLYLQISELIDNLQASFNLFPVDFTINLRSLIANMSDSLIAITTQIGKGAFRTAVSIPEILIFTIVTLLSTYFLSADREKISLYFKTQFPEQWIYQAKKIKTDMFSALFGYIKTQIIMMCITFFELFIGFSIMNIKYKLILAVSISIIDAFPILGTGGVLVPWSIYSLITGNIRLGVSLVILYLVILIVRQLLEPKVLGHQIGLYPLVTLLAMYVGLKTIGFVGLILGPITFLLLRNIFSTVYKDKPLKDLIKPD